jgi:hypothetical protein
MTYYLTESLNLRETLAVAAVAEQVPVSRFRFGSPCRFIRWIDVAVHLVVPEILERPLPTIARYLRSTSPRWGRSWRSW